MARPILKIFYLQMIFYSYIIGLQYNNFVVEFVEFFYCFFSTSEEDYMQNDNQLLHYELL